MTVLVLMGGMSTERDVSLSTGAAVATALVAAGHSAPMYDLDPRAGRDVFDLVTSHVLRDADVVFIALHGGEGEDGRIQAMLDLLGIPYTGSGVRASALCMDKAVSKIIFERHGIPTPEWYCIKGDSVDPDAAMQAISGIGGLPIVVKPNDQGSTIGISIVKALGELEAAIRLAQRYSTCVILEKYIGGRELSVPIVGDEVFPVVEIRPKQGFYDYERKYTKGMTHYECPAPIGDDLSRKIQDDAVKAYEVLGCDGFGRVDVRLDEDDIPYFLEINTIPGMTETSLVPMAAKARGMSFPELIDRITSLALMTAGVKNQKSGG
ncbi:MAG: D-alanine--D-alanine ligase [Candidatus Eisenbacteria bacterium]